MNSQHSVVARVDEDQDANMIHVRTGRTSIGDDYLMISVDDGRADASLQLVLTSDDVGAKARIVWEFANRLHAAAERLRLQVGEEIEISIAERDHERLDNGQPIDITSRQSIPAIVAGHIEAVRRAVHGDRAEETAASHPHAIVGDDGGFQDGETFVSRSTWKVPDEGPPTLVEQTPFVRAGLEDFGPLRQSRIVGAVGDDLILEREPGVPPAHDEERHSGLDGSDFRFVVGCPRCEWDNAAGDRSVD